MDLLALACALQLIVVTTPDWDDIEGVLYRYKRASVTDAWHLPELLSLSH